MIDNEKTRKAKIRRIFRISSNKVEDCYKKETESAIKDYLKKIKIVEEK